MKSAKVERIDFKNYPKLNERWVQDRTAEDPRIFGLGDKIIFTNVRLEHGQL